MPRIMDLAYLRDGDLVHAGEAVTLALLLHTKGSKKRSKRELIELEKVIGVEDGTFDLADNEK